MRKRISPHDRRYNSRPFGTFYSKKHKRRVFFHTINRPRYYYSRSIKELIIAKRKDIVRSRQFKVVEEHREKYEWSAWHCLSSHKGDIYCPSYAASLRRCPSEFSIIYQNSEDCCWINSNSINFLKYRCEEYDFSFVFRLLAMGAITHYVFEFSEELHMVLFKLFVSEAIEKYPYPTYA